MNESNENDLDDTKALIETNIRNDELTNDELKDAELTNDRHTNDSIKLYDILLLHLLILIDSNDKPTIFVIFPFIILCINIYFHVFNILWSSIVIFLIYEYICGNIIYRFCIDLFFYYLLVFVILYFI
ncbi:hypothetical protein DMUE_0475 [Dictyocoela muelleri]|nr:hypothetical protein DMUE_0475 [Dictyocoela muelleri]